MGADGDGQAIESRDFRDIRIGEVVEARLGAGAGAADALARAFLLIAEDLPGPGASILSHTVEHAGRGAPTLVRLTARAKKADGATLRLALEALDAAGAAVLTGEVTALAARTRQQGVRSAGARPRGAGFAPIIAAAAALPPMSTAIVHPCDAASLLGALEAQARGVITPVLVGPRAKILAAAEAAERSLDGLEIVEAPHSHAAADLAVALVRSGRVEALMKGALHTDEIMAAAVDAAHGLRTARRMSHVFMLDAPSYRKPLYVTDAAINIAPDLDAKRDIAQNAIDLARAVGVERPKLAILSAVETVTAKIASTLDAAALCKMAERGQITGGLLDGPLAFDNAISAEAARAKGLVSAVAGDPDILLAPDLEAGNMIAKQLVHLAGAEAAGVVMGARCPIMLTSRSDGSIARLASAALARLAAHRRPPVQS